MWTWLRLWQCDHVWILSCTADCLCISLFVPDFFRLCFLVTCRQNFQANISKRSWCPLAGRWTTVTCFTDLAQLVSKEKITFLNISKVSTVYEYWILSTNIEIKQRSFDRFRPYSLTVEKHCFIKSLQNKTIPNTTYQYFHGGNMCSFISILWELSCCQEDFFWRVADKWFLLWKWELLCTLTF